MDFLSTNSFLLMEKSLGFLWTKQAAILDNIANAETPNYKAKVVTFEETVRSKLETARSGVKPRQTARQVLEESEFAVTEHLDSARMDENGINVTAQSVEAMRNAYQMQYVFQSLTSDITALRTAISG